MAHEGVWVKFRKPISKYPITPQQKKVKVGGELIKQKCEGKTGEDFSKCRSEVLKCAFHDEECDEELTRLKREIFKKFKYFPNAIFPKSGDLIIDGRRT